MRNDSWHGVPPGFTAVELLVVVAILGTLMAALLPAVQVARESARLTQCKSNLKQISLGILHHEEQLQHFPFGGWGHEWVGVSGRGSGVSQPGGWVFNLLPYLELGPLQQIGSSFQGDDAFSERLQTPIECFVCPTRRPVEPWNVLENPRYLSHPRPAGEVTRVARGDYAINGGTSNISSFPGPTTLAVGDSSGFSWPRLRDFNGISHLRVGVEAKLVVDGLVNTYLVGEKFLSPDYYATGQSQGDNETLYSGFATDLHRFAREDLPLCQDRTEVADSSGQLRFGSAHLVGANMAFADGSVRHLSFDIEPTVHMSHANRQD